MAQTYEISSGSATIEIEGTVEQTDIIAIQVVSDSDLDAKVKINLAQSIDGVLWHDLPETPINADAGANSNLLQTKSFYTNRLAVVLDVQTATTGILTIFNPKVD